MEQLLHIANMLFIHKEQDHMVAGCDHGVIVRDNDLFIANDGANRGTRRQADILDGLADHLARFRIAMGNGLDGFCRAPAQ
ncbi:hypothetical protein D3C84_1224530 [compost metagenome]